MKRSSLAGHKKRLTVFFAVFLIAFSLVPWSSVGAINKVDDMDNLTDKAKSYAYYELIKYCFSGRSFIGQHSSADKLEGNNIFTHINGGDGTGPGGSVNWLNNEYVSGTSGGGGGGGGGGWGGENEDVITQYFLANYTLRYDVGSAFRENTSAHCDYDGNTLAKSALAFWGINAMDLICSNEFDGIYERKDGQSCKNGTNNFDVEWGNGDAARAFHNYILNNVGEESVSPSPATIHELRKLSIINACTTRQAIDPSSFGSADSSTYVDITEFSGETYRYQIDREVLAYDDFEEDNNGGDSDALSSAALSTCRNLATSLDDQKALVGNSECRESGYTGERLEACVQGFLNPQDEFCAARYDGPRTISVPEREAPAGTTITTGEENPLYNACVDGARKNNESISSEEDPGDGRGGSDPTTSCAVEGGLGWVICPVVTAMANIADAAYGFLEDNFLRINANLLNTDSGTYTAWGSVRNIANVVFVIVFLIIIFSQITSFGIDNYGIKKMLPRLIIAAILVNVSFFITQLAVDLSNIVGYGTKTGLSSIVDPPENLGGTFGQEGSNVFGDIGIAAITGAAVGLTVWASLSALIPVLLAAVVALLVVFLMLILREMLIVLLVVVSPLAFVMFLLPNTKPLFDKWRKMFTALLLVFPITGLIYGSSTLAANVLQGTYPEDDMMGQIIVAAIMTLPLFLIPIFLKKSLDGVPALGAAMNRLSSKASGGASKWGGNKYEQSRLGQFQKYRVEEASKRRGLMQSGAYRGKGGKANLRNWRSGANRRFNDSRLSGSFGNRSAASGISLADEMDKKAEQDAMKRLGDMNLSGSDYRKVAATHSDSAMRAAAVKNIVQSNDVVGMNELIERAHTMDESSRVALSSALQEHSGRPKYIGQGTLAMVRAGKQQTIGGNNGIVAKAIRSNAYSPEAVAKGDGDELNFVADTINSSNDPALNDARLSLADAADKAKKDDILKSLIGKNAAAVDHLDKMDAPTQDELDLLKRDLGSKL